MSNAFAGSRQQMYSPYSQIGVDPFGYSAGGTFMGGYGGYGGGFGMPGARLPSSSFLTGGGYGGASSMYGMQDLYGGMSGYGNPFVPGFSSGIGGYGGGYPTSFGGINLGGGSMGYQFPVPPQPSVNDLFGQYMMNQYYGGGAFNPYQTPGFGYGGGYGGFGGGGLLGSLFGGAVGAIPSGDGRYPRGPALPDPVYAPGGGLPSVPFETRSQIPSNPAPSSSATIPQLSQEQIQQIRDSLSNLNFRL